MHQIIAQTGKDIDTLIKHFENEGILNVNPIGITGFSMGGYAAYYIAATNPRIQAAVPMAGVPAFVNVWEDVTLESSSYAHWAERMESAKDETAIRTKFMKENDPFDKLANFYPKPLLMVNGDLDTDAPKRYSVGLYRKLKPIYRDHSERLRLKIYDGVGHQLTAEMIKDACDWFESFLCTK